MESTVVSLILKQKDYLKKVPLTSSLGDLGYDSFSFVELVLAIEDELGIEFEDEYLSYLQFDCVSDLVAYVECCTSRLKISGT